MFLIFSGFYTLSTEFFVCEFSLGTSETVLGFTLVRPLKLVPPPGVSLQQIHFLVIFICSESKLSHLDVIILLILYHVMSQ